ncbi:hypothetical protein KY289_016531 [Solanum tuberosum]|nr:hypothetical protein KY289_016531 [Solanum tuberosum]
MDENNSNLGVHKGGCKLLVYERRNREPHRGNEGEKKWRSVGGGKWVKYDYNQARGNAGGVSGECMDWGGGEAQRRCSGRRLGQVWGDGTFLVGQGDFNIIRFLEEKRTLPNLKCQILYAYFLELAPGACKSLYQDWSQTIHLSNAHFIGLLVEEEGRDLRSDMRMWLKATNFGEKVNGCWSSYVVEGRPYRLAIKMKMLKIDLRVWNKEVFGRSPLMWFFEAPISVTRKLERLQWNFRRDLVEGAKKYHLVRCETVTTPKCCGVGDGGGS